MKSKQADVVETYGLDRERSLGFLSDEVHPEEYQRRLYLHANLQLLASDLPTPLTLGLLNRGRPAQRWTTPVPSVPAPIRPRACAHL